MKRQTSFGNFLGLVVLFGTCLSLTSATTCPEESVLKETGCSCIQNRRLDSLPELRCTSENLANGTDLGELMKRLNDAAKGQVQHFESLHWEGGKKVEIKEGFFGKLITFRQLLLGTPERFCFVSRVHPKAFSSMTDHLVHFAIRSLELTNDADLYSAIQTLKKLEYLTVEGRYLTTVPANAFTPIVNCLSVEGCGLRSLKRVNFSEGWYETIIHVTRLEQFAFANLPALEEINLKQQDVYYIGDYAFASGSGLPTSERLKIDLSLQWNEKFNSSSFAPFCLADINRPVELDLFGNPFIDHLPEAVFKPFFEADTGNVVRLGMTMKCNCTMKWLWERPEVYKKHFIPWVWTDKSGDDGREHTVQCSDEEELWDLDGVVFENCDSEAEKVKIEKTEKEPATPILLETKEEL